MFTGIVEEVGKIADIHSGAKSSQLIIAGKKIFQDLHIGDSVAVNGVCLTTTRISSNTFMADVMSETLNRSSLGQLRKNSEVNLERAMSANGRFGGHIVSGHIDGTGIITNITTDDNAIWYSIKASKEILRYIVEKGSIAIDGISLTVARITDGEFSVSIIPHTQRETILSTKKCNDIVNLENDIVGKYVEKLVGLSTSSGNVTGRQIQDNRNSDKNSNNISEEFLIKNGYM